MLRYCKTILSLALASAMVAMAGCAGVTISPSSTGPDTQQTAMGRYVERDCVLPATPTVVEGLTGGPDGAVCLFASHAGAENMELFSSADNGDTWSVQAQGMVEASGLSEIYAICRKSDGGILVAGVYFSPEFLVELEAFQAKGGGYSEDLDWPLMQLMDVAPDGTVREIALKLPGNAAGYINKMAIAPGGELPGGELAVQSYNEIYRFALDTGALLGTITMDSPITSIAFCDNRLVAMADGVATIFDFESGDPLETVEQLGFTRPTAQLNVSTTDNDINSLAAVGEDGAFYFCTGAGIYRRTADGGMVERIVDGTLVSLGTPSIELLDMLVVPDGFLVAMRDTVNDSVMLKKYVYDPDVPTLPSKSLRIYTLAENKTIRQTIGDYQLAHPDTHVVLEIAPQELSTADAIRTLNTELLAGRGPDMLVLDGMPIESYLEKGVLLPLDEMMLEGTQSNITQAGRGEDGKLYSVPLRFAMPAVTVSNQIPVLDSITAIADAAVLLGEKQKGSVAGMVLQNSGMGMLLNTLYPVFEHTLQTDGKPDEAKLRSFLEQLHRITQMQDANRSFLTDDSPTARLDMQWTPLMWCLGNDVMGMGYIASFRDFANAATAVTRVPDSRMEAISPAGSHPFVPLSSLGICTGSENAETAAAFMKMALSQQIQKYDFKDGLPVSSAALDDMLTRGEDDKDTMGAYGISDSDGETTAINIDFPSPQALAELRGMIDALDTPTRDNRVLLELLRSETADYFEDRDSLDSIMTTLWQKLKLLDAE